MSKLCFLFVFAYICLTAGAQNSPPTVSHMTIKSTDAVNYITGMSALSGGTIVSSDGGASNTARGICWSSTDTLPKVTNSEYTVDGAGDGRFISTMTNLTYNTTYYVRSYATYSIGYEYANGVTYGPPISFATSGVFPDIWCVGVIVHRNTANRLEIIFNVRLLPIIPSTSAFTVTVNGQVAQVYNVQIYKNLVYVFLSKPILAEDIIIISYTKPTQNPLTEVTANREINSINEYTVNNQMSNTVIPLLPFLI